MLNKIITIIFIFGFTVSCHAAEPVSKAKVAKINLALLTALHPQMANFDFRAVGFYRIPLGLKSSQRSDAIDKLREDPIRIEQLRKSMNDAIRNRIQAYNDLTVFMNEHDIINKGRESLTNSEREQYDNLSKKVTDARSHEFNTKYAYKYPEFTSPDETKAILSQIEKETTEAVKDVAKSLNYDIVLNSSVPVPFGYPVKYRHVSTYYNGPINIEQKLYYSIIAEPPDIQTSDDLSSFIIKNWITSINGAPVQDYLPVKPHSMILSGGDDIFPDVLKFIYLKHKISEKTYLFISNLLKKEFITEER